MVLHPPFGPGNAVRSRCAGGDDRTSAAPRIHDRRIHADGAMVRQHAANEQPRPCTGSKAYGPVHLVGDPRSTNNDVDVIDRTDGRAVDNFVPTPVWARFLSMKAERRAGEKGV